MLLDAFFTDTFTDFSDVPFKRLRAEKNARISNLHKPKIRGMKTQVYEKVSPTERFRKIMFLEQIILSELKANPENYLRTGR